SIEAIPGLGEALVSGRVNADVYKVRDGAIVAKTVRAATPVLDESQLATLEQLGRRIEAHFGAPQDIEWCLAAGEFQIVQSRPITTLFPIPAAADDKKHVYLSVGHQQMMTDAMKPLGISLHRKIPPIQMSEAGGRLFVDVAPHLESSAGRAGLLGLMGKDAPLTADAVQTILDRGFIPLKSDAPAPRLPRVPITIESDPSIVATLMENNRASVKKLESEIRAQSGPELIDFILADMQELKRLLFDSLSHQAIMAGMEATWWINDHMSEWLGEPNAADVLTLSVPSNVTSEMGLALMDVADVIRRYTGVVQFLERGGNEEFLNELPAVEGGREARAAIEGWLDRFGMRGVGEIDVTRPRWRERPSMLLPTLLANVRNFEPGEAARRFEQGRREAAKKEEELLKRLRALPDGEAKAEETKRQIDRLRTFIGYREYPKFGMISRTFLYKQAIMREADHLARAGVLREKEDVFFLTLEELRVVLGTSRVDDQLIRQRKDTFHGYEGLTPPRVMTSEGESVAGSYKRAGLPAGALTGLPVSSGIVEGRARVLLDVSKAHLEPGDILVTRYTDPSWTPLFLGVKALVTEVGGQMTHGAVIAREYGLPAVVGVENATQAIRDGDRIRVNGTDGYVEFIPS
ncbi:MAG TPA: phosphoenolpyruvate synthase, partial [Gemmatimonadaceae bacterium]